MEYLVKMAYVDPGPLLGPDHSAQVVESLVVPSFKKLAELKASGKIRGGGAVSGARAAVFIVDVADNAELDQLLLSIPLWRIVKTDATPLQDFSKRSEHMQHVVTQLKARP
ncbi:MAG TPA: muconolactone Delta-isomerase family protein [Rhodocyclaceae bacterium]